MIISLIHSLSRPDELSAMIRLKMSQKANKTTAVPLGFVAKTMEPREFCYAVLDKVSRSFAAVIQQLPPDLKDPVCVFYLVLRGLDTIEDDMSLESSKKIELLKSFHEKHYSPKWFIEGIGEDRDYQVLLENYEKVILTFQKLEEPYQEIITNICRQMGEGMARFVNKKVETVEDYNLYCHYVAGLVGIGLSQLFSISKLEDENLMKETDLANSMGLFLQKTNIIRDYTDDLRESRIFWPTEIWSKYGNEYRDFFDHPKGKNSIHCLNSMITDALQHATDCLKYLGMIRNPNVFKFCAIPQVMAIATLSKLYNNHQVFIENVKIRKGLAAKLILQTKSMDDVNLIFSGMIKKIISGLEKNDPNYQFVLEIEQKIFQIIREGSRSTLTN